MSSRSRSTDFWHVWHVIRFSSRFRQAKYGCGRLTEHVPNIQSQQTWNAVNARTVNTRLTDSTWFFSTAARKHALGIKKTVPTDRNPSSWFHWLTIRLISHIYCSLQLATVRNEGQRTKNTNNEPAILNLCKFDGCWLLSHVYSHVVFNQTTGSTTSSHWLCGRRRVARWYIRQKLPHCYHPSRPSPLQQGPGYHSQKFFKLHMLICGF